jgi:mono/diheme cytochrome c family protein
MTLAQPPGFTQGLPAFRIWLCLAAALCLTGCDRLDMYDQPRYEALEESNFFPDGLSARQPVEGTVSRGSLREDDAFFTGKENGKFISRISDKVLRKTHDRDQKRFNLSYEKTDQADLRRALLERGQDRFNIYCSVCHGRLGDGDGMVVRRGFRKPPSYHIDRLRQVPAGYLYDVLTNGFGAMPSFANRIDVDDRWAIVAYIRGLQLSQNAVWKDIPDDQREQLSPPVLKAPVVKDGAPQTPRKDSP